MRVKRGKNYIGLRLSGPHSTNTLNEAEVTAERLAARNAWAFQMSQFYPNLPPCIAVERCTQYPIDRFKREMVLRLDESDGWWEVDARHAPVAPVVTPPTPPTPTPPAPPMQSGAPSNGGDDGDDDDGSNGGQNVSGGSQHKPSSGGASNTPPPPKPEADEYQPISAAPRRIHQYRSTQSQIASRIHDEWQRLRQTSLFCHIEFAFAEKMDDLAAAARRFLAVAQKALVLSHELYVGLYSSFSGAEQIVQDRWAGAAPEQKTFEFAGFSLTLLDFTARTRPIWDYSLFGRLPEDEQVAA